MTTTPTGRILRVYVNNQVADATQDRLAVIRRLCGYSRRPGPADLNMLFTSDTDILHITWRAINKIINEQ